MSQFNYCKSSLKDYTNLQNTRVYFTANSLPVAIIMLLLIWMVGGVILIAGLIFIAIIGTIIGDDTFGSQFLGTILAIMIISSLVIIFVYGSYLLITGILASMKKNTYYNNCEDFVSEYISDNPI